MAAGTSAEPTGPADCTLVYLVRHGQTPLNESGVLRSLLDPPLDEAGHLQAGRLGWCWAPAGPPSSSPARCCGRGRPHSRSPTVPVVKWLPIGVCLTGTTGSGLAQTGSQ